MTTTTDPRPNTFLYDLLRAIDHCCQYNAEDQVPPAALLWTDADRQWEPLLPRLRELLPQFLTLGP
ncbi:MAG: hypothetical protein IPJ58_07265 [Ardenticatenia bacterium]|nr:hypothetical protein [Ardenticatenia bacterium]